MLTPRIKSSLNDAAHTTKVLKKIKDLHAQKASRLVFKVLNDRYSATECTLVVIDENAQTISYTDPQGVPQSKVLADISSIQRIRNKKYLISFT